jgi:spore coat protein U-like protein
MTSGPNSLSYTLSRPPGGTTNWGNTKGVDAVAGTTGGTGGQSTDLTIYGQLTVGQYPVPDGYTDTITATAQNSGQTGQFSVTANVVATCTISATNLAFGNDSGALKDNTATLTITCTSGTPYNVGLNAGTATGATVTNRKMTSPASATLSYTLSGVAAGGANWGGTGPTGWSGDGTAQPRTVYGRMAAGLSLATAGTFTDTIIATITY